MDIVKKGTKYFFDGTPFKVIYFILTLLAFNSFTAHTTFMNIFAWVVTGLGGIVLLYRVIFLKRFIKTPNLLFLGLFLVSFIISALVNYKYGVLGSVKGFIWMAFQFCLLYACDDTKEPGFYKREFHILSAVLLVYLAIGAVASYYYLVTGEYGSFELVRPMPVYYGLLWQRLWGVFSEPNNAATAMSIAIFISFYLFKICKQIWIKIGCWVLIAIYASYILFSDSRTGLLCLMIGAAIISYLLIINPNKRNWKKVTTQLIAIAIAAVVAAGCFFGIYFGKKAYNAIQSSISSSQAQDPNSNNNNNNQKPGSTSIGRDMAEGEDFSNRRFDIWGSGFDLFKTSPIFGVANRNIIAAAEDKIPETYIVNNDQGKFSSFHNMFIDILASQGIVGIIIIAAFMILSIIWLLNLLVQKLHKDYMYVITIFTTIICIGATALISPDVFYVNTQNAFLFWTFLGYLMHLANKKRRERKAVLQADLKEEPKENIELKDAE